MATSSPADPDKILETQRAVGDSLPVTGGSVPSAPLPTGIAPPTDAAPFTGAVSTQTASPADEPPSLPQQRASYVQFRVQRSNNWESELNDLKEQTQKAEDTIRDASEKLKRRKFRLVRFEYILKEVEGRLNAAKKSYEVLQKQFTEQENKTSGLRSLVERGSDKIDSAEAEIRKLEERKQGLRKEMARGKVAETKLARQADILLPDPEDQASLVKHVAANKSFRTSLTRVSEGTATPAMQRDVKSELFDRYISIHKDDFTEFAQKVLAASQGLSRDPVHSGNNRSAVTSENNEEIKTQVETVESSTTIAPEAHTPTTTQADPNSLVVPVDQNEGAANNSDGGDKSNTGHESSAPTSLKRKQPDSPSDSGPNARESPNKQDAMTKDTIITLQ